MITMAVCIQHPSDEKVQFVLGCHVEDVLMSECVLHVPAVLIIWAFIRFLGTLSRVICVG